MGSYSGTKHERQGRDCEKSSTSKASRTFSARENRARNLRDALSASIALWQAGIQSPDHAAACPRLFTRMQVELAGLEDGLSDANHVRVAAIALVFNVDRAIVGHWWASAAGEASTARAQCVDAATKRLVADGKATLGHRKLVDLQAVSVAFEKTPERDKLLFSRKPGRPRIYTGLPALKPDYSNCISVVPDGPGTDRLTTAERKALVIELGVSIQTVRVHERDDTLEEFSEWVARRRQIKAKKAAKVAEQMKRDGRRRRKPGKTAAVRSFASYMGKSVSWAWSVCADLSIAQVEAMLPRLVEIGGGRQADAKKQPEVSRNVSRKSAVWSDKKSDKAAQNTVFPGNFPLNNATKRKRSNVTRGRRPKLAAYKYRLLVSWFSATTGKNLLNNTIAQWQRRGVLDKRFDEASEWFEETHAGESSIERSEAVADISYEQLTEADLAALPF